MQTVGKIDGLPYTVTDVEVRVAPGASIAHLTLSSKDGALLSLGLTREDLVGLSGLLVAARREIDRT